MVTSKPPLSERKQTDAGLATERAKTDHALANQKEALEHKADRVIDRARAAADEVLDTARAKADDKARVPAEPEQARASIERERAAEDELVKQARAAADEALRRERARSLSRLLPLERDKTDKYLLTERARSDDALANRDDFLGMVSHDLRDLLNGVALSAEFIASSSPAGEPGLKVLAGVARIQRSTVRMARLIGDLVDVASIDAGKLAIVRTRVDLAQVVNEALDTCGPPAQAKGIALENVVGSPVMVDVDVERILQILGNLVTNAVKFTATAGRIVIRVEPLGRDARVSVEDSGVGIPSDKLEAIFERFWQVGGNDHRGLGLGLFISRCLVDAHGGRLWAESELGRGSTFYFTVPLAG